MNNTGPLALSALALILIVLLLWLAYQVFIRPYRRTFEDESVRLELSPGEGVVHITTSQDAKPATLKLGCGQFNFSKQVHEVTREKWHAGSSGSITIYNSGSGISHGSVTPGTEGWMQTITKDVATGFTLVTIHEIDPIVHYHRRWATHPEVNAGPPPRLILSTFLSNGAARALERWVNAHSKQLIPPEGNIRMAWEKSCEKQLKTCRKAPQVRALKRPLELYDFDNEPSIRYLAIDKEGAACFRGCGITAHEVDFDDLMAQGMTVTVPLPDGRQATFAMKEAQVASLHKIRSRWQKHQRMHG